MNSVTIKQISKNFLTKNYDAVKAESAALVSGKLSTYGVFRYCFEACLLVQKYEGVENELTQKRFMTVITINLNNLEGLKKTVVSVLEQINRKHIQYIVIDGGSTDGSLQYLDEVSNLIDICVFGKDEGIYDAMNRACVFINSDYTIFMNSGDYFFDQTIGAQVENIVNESEDSPTGIYGYVKPYGYDIWPVKSLDEMWKGMCFSHQSLFLRSKHLSNNPFNTESKVTADYKLIYETYLKNGPFINSEICIAHIEPGGISSDFRSRTIERWKTVREATSNTIPKPKIDDFYLDLLNSGETNKQPNPRSNTESVEQRLIFIISTPRSGSTLLQKILEQSTSVATASEPWLMLPLLSMYDKELISAKYSQDHNIEAMNEVLESIGDPEDIVLGAQKQYANSIYSHIISKTQGCYFLDKTPRYIYIIDKLVALYPEAKFIVLLRNPAEVISSYAQTWFGGSYKLLMDNDPCRYDITKGFLKLANFVESKFENRIVIKYEDLINEPHDTCKEVFNYLKIPFEDKYTNYNSKPDTNNKYKFGDPSSVYEKSRPDPDNSNKWLRFLNTPIQLSDFTSVLDLVPNETITTLGYDKNDILRLLNETKGFKSSIRKFFGYFDKVYCISLPDSKDRKKHIIDSIGESLGSNFSFFDATTSEDDLVRDAYSSGFVKSYPNCFRCDNLECGKDNCNNILIPSQVATFFSYKRLWEEIVRDGIQTVLIFEDDLAFNTYASKIISSDNFFDLLENTNIKQRKEVLVRFGWALSEEHQYSEEFHFATDAFKMSNPCHGINIDFAKKCLSLLRHIDTTVDVYQHITVAGQSDHHYTLQPPIAHELSWSTGGLDSLIHPKEVRLDYLTKNKCESTRELEVTKLKLKTHKQHITPLEILVYGPYCFENNIMEPVIATQLAHKFSKDKIRYTSNIFQILSPSEQILHSQNEYLFSNLKIFFHVDFLDCFTYLLDETNKVDIEKFLNSLSEGCTKASIDLPVTMQLDEFIYLYLEWFESVNSNEVFVIRSRFITQDLSQFVDRNYVDSPNSHPDLDSRSNQHLSDVHMFLEKYTNKISDPVADKLKDHYKQNFDYVF